MTRTCRVCNQTKPIEGFHLHSAYKDGIDARCRECTNKYQREYRKNWGPEGDFKNKKRFLKNKYGLDYETYLKMVENQDGLCAICRCPPPFAVDHCHKTGKIRGFFALPAI